MDTEGERAEGEAGEGCHAVTTALSSISACALVLILASFPTPRGRLGCKARFMNKEKLSHPLINFMGHVDMYKSDINMLSRARAL